jgi:hypothetical protein
MVGDWRLTIAKINEMKQAESIKKKRRKTKATDAEDTFLVRRTDLLFVGTSNYFGPDIHIIYLRPHYLISSLPVLIHLDTSFWWLQGEA